MNASEMVKLLREVQADLPPETPSHSKISDVLAQIEGPCRHLQALEMAKTQMEEYIEDLEDSYPQQARDYKSLYLKQYTEALKSPCLSDEPNFDLILQVYEPGGPEFEIRMQVKAVDEPDTEWKYIIPGHMIRVFRKKKYV